jgi:hypothetical protein
VPRVFRIVLTHFRTTVWSCFYSQLAVVHCGRSDGRERGRGEAWRGLQRRKGRERSLGETLVEDRGRFHTVAKLQDLWTMWTRMLAAVLMEVRSPTPALQSRSSSTPQQGRLGCLFGVCAQPCSLWHSRSLNSSCSSTAKHCPLLCADITINSQCPRHSSTTNVLIGSSFCRSAIAFHSGHTVLANMTWLSVLGSVLYYLSLPFTTVFTTVYNWVLIALAPALHLGHYLFSGMLLPLRLLAKFEVGKNIVSIAPC